MPTQLLSIQREEFISSNQGIEAAYKGEVISLRIPHHIKFDQFKGSNQELTNSELDDLCEIYPLLHRNYILRLKSIFQNTISLNLVDPILKRKFTSISVTMTNPDFEDSSNSEDESFITIMPNNKYYKNKAIKNIINDLIFDVFKNVQLSIDDIKLINNSHNIIDGHNSIALISAFYHYADMIIDNIDYRIGDTQFWKDLNKDNDEKTTKEIFTLSQYFVILESMFLVHHTGKTKSDSITLFALELENELDLITKFKSLENTFEKMNTFYQQKSDNDSIIESKKEGRRDLIMGFFIFLTGVFGFILGVEKEDGAFIFSKGSKPGPEGYVFDEIFKNALFIYSVQLLLLSAIAFGIWYWVSNKKTRDTYRVEKLDIKSSSSTQTKAKTNTRMK